MEPFYLAPRATLTVGCGTKPWRFLALSLQSTGTDRFSACKGTCTRVAVYNPDFKAPPSEEFGWRIELCHLIMLH